FTDKQIALLVNFAAQAVIAIENARLLSELRESLQQQTATADVLKVISRSAFDLQTVLNALVESAARLCAAQSAPIHRPKGEFYPYVASYGYSHEYNEYMRAHPIRVDRGTVLGRALLEHRAAQVADVLTHPGYGVADREAAHMRARVGGFRTVLAVPLLREGTPIGVIILTRAEVRPFTDSQIELVETFADQAVIAIENVRLFDEVQARTRELSESLEQQTATAEVLRVISSSPGELEAVFQAMLANAVRICGANFGNLYLREAEEFRIAAAHNTPPAMIEARRRMPIRTDTKMPVSRVIRTKQTVHILDMRAEEAYLERDPLAVAAVELGGVRTLVIVPMLKEQEVIRTITIFRQEAGRSRNRQMELVTNLANKAVIAIETTRLLNELRESLQQQTATADVLQVISGSPGDLEPVFNAMLENAVRICEAKFGNLFLYRDGALRIVAMHNPPPAYAERWRQDPIVVVADNPQMPVARLARTKKGLHIADLTSDPGYAARDPRIVSTADAAGIRTMLLVPMLKEEELVGAIVIPPGDAAICGQADRAGQKLRGPGRHCHREHTAAQRAAGVAAAA